MKKLVTIFVSVFVGLLFLSNIGISFNKHFCKKDGFSISFFQKEDHECNHIDKKSKCCQTKKEDADCCRDEMFYHQVKLDFSNTVFKFKFNQPVITSIVPIYLEANEVNNHLNNLSNYPNPPPEAGRFLLLKKQVLRL